MDHLHSMEFMDHLTEAAISRYSADIGGPLIFYKLKEVT